MAQAEQLPLQVLEKVRVQVGPLIALEGLRPSGEVSLRLGESFRIYRTDRKAFERATQKRAGLLRSTRKTRRWVHLVTEEGRPTAVAFSAVERVRDPTSGTQVQSVFKSRLASKLKEAIDWIDRERPEDQIEARLIVLPSYHSYAFVLRMRKRREVVVVDSPYSTPGPVAGEAYAEREFLERIAAVKTIRGLAFENT